MTTKNDVESTPAKEVNQPEETVTPEQDNAEQSAEETIGAALFEEQKEPDTIPKARLDKEIARRKELEKSLEELQQKAADKDMSRSEIASDLESLAKEHDIDASFLNKLAGAIEARAEARFEERLKPITEREKEAKRDAAFQRGYAKAIENLPEYADIVNPAVIKTLSLDPSNANKTFTQLIEETYGGAVVGKKTIEKAVPRGGNASGELDYERAKRDTAYFKEVMADPALKKKYNDRMFEEA